MYFNWKHSFETDEAGNTISNYTHEHTFPSGHKIQIKAGEDKTGFGGGPGHFVLEYKTKAPGGKHFSYMAGRNNGSPTDNIAILNHFKNAVHHFARTYKPSGYDFSATDADEEKERKKHRFNGRLAGAVADENNGIHKQTPWSHGVHFPNNYEKWGRTHGDWSVWDNYNKGKAA